VTFGAISGRALLMLGLVVCALGLVFGIVIYSQLKNLPVHASMLEIAELIYERARPISSPRAASCSCWRRSSA